MGRGGVSRAAPRGSCTIVSATCISCVCVCVCVCVRARACLFVYGIYIYRPHTVKDFINFVLLKFCFMREGAQGPPLVTSVKCLFYCFKAITLFFCVLLKFFFMRVGTQGPPLVNPFNNVFFKFMMQITS
jgi:hypothetical protein